MAWPFIAASARLLIAAGGGWVAVAAFGCPPAVVFGIVAAASVIAALVFVAAALTGSIWTLIMSDEHSQEKAARARDRGRVLLSLRSAFAPATLSGD